jgi:uncharacterized protein
MLIDLRELLSGSQDERIEKVSIESESFDTGIAKYNILEKPEFELCITRIGKNKLEIKAESFVVLDIPCDRCLESVPTKVEYSVDEIVDFSDNAAGEEAKEEKDYIGGYELDVDRLVFGEILISMPGKTLCTPDCKGLCSICGHNLNVSECGCDRESLDPRMSVFKDILKNFKEV